MIGLLYLFLTGPSGLLYFPTSFFVVLYFILSSSFLLSLLSVLHISDFQFQCCPIIGWFCIFGLCLGFLFSWSAVINCWLLFLSFPNLVQGFDRPILYYGASCVPEPPYMKNLMLLLSLSNCPLLRFIPVTHFCGDIPCYFIIWWSGCSKGYQPCDFPEM